MNQNNKYKKSTGGNRRNEAEMRKALQEIIRLVEGWVDSDERKAEATMLKILNTALEVV
jgi:antitoxin component HigA of HigAB toxin-antitoxin module